MRSTKSPSWIERAFGLAPLPVPPHVFSLSGERLAYGCFEHHPKGFELTSYEAVPLPPESFQPGLLGGPLKEPRIFEEALGTLLARLEGTVSEASLILPDAWLRVTFTELSELPSRPEAKDEVLRWKLKRLVPFRVDELRLEAVEVDPLPQQEEPRRLLLGFALEGLLTQLEEIFAKAGVAVGQIANDSLALAEGLGNGGRGDLFLVVLVGQEGYTLVFLRRGEPALYRHKPFTGSVSAAARSRLVSRDLKLTGNFLAEHFPGERLERVIVASPPEVEPAWLEWIREGLEAPAEPLGRQHLPPVSFEHVATPPDATPIWSELAPMLGAASREVS